MTCIVFLEKCEIDPAEIIRSDVGNVGQKSRRVALSALWNCD